jgi:hypothetical protein
MLIFGVLAELNAQNAQKQPVSCPQLSPSSSPVVSQPLQVRKMQLSKSNLQDDDLDDEASGTRSTTGNQEATAQVHSAAPCVSANTRKLNLQTQLGFKNKRAYNDFRVYYFYFGFALTVDLGAGSYH